MLKGIGIDVIEVSRIEQAIERHGKKFLQRFCTPGELKYAQKKSARMAEQGSANLGNLDCLADAYELAAAYDVDDLYDLDAPNSWKIDTLAGIYAAKEAFSKAMGTGIARGVNLRDIEVVYRETGAPQYKLSGSTKELFLNRGYTASFLSISHDAGVAVAFAVITDD